ncbi:ferredoxin [Sulfuricella sp. T08]|uniref:ferredoxin III, nif-specific n=1 Tax=Sulfuricella sp. T08 TaxID=1632857 RepID=UPI0006179DF4|nr:ferredoxin III, nif-specific [Sulfuricella sp. T08]GAO35460.1 ferredoxin [Sulfuricella sp. T08]
MAAISITMPDGRTWTPQFVQEINQEKCIGCGRCFKVCGRDVLQLVGIDEDGEIVVVEADSDDDDEYEKKVMTISNQTNCVGCEACAKICPKKCYSHAPMSEG